MPEDVPDTVRLATPEDAGLVAGLRREWTEENAGRSLSDDTFDERFAAWWERESDQRLTWLAFPADAPEPVGMLNLLVFTRMPWPGPASRPDVWGYVANVFVRPSQRDVGVGARLLAACTAYAEDRRLARLVLSPSERSIPFYARAGFEPATSLMVRHLT